MRIGVFGTTNDIGRGVVDRLLSLGHEVIALDRRETNAKTEYIQFDLRFLNQPINTELDSVVLLSWIGSPRNSETMGTNVSAYKLLASEMKQKRVFPVFISTVTANSLSRSVHSRAKYEAEALFDGWGSILRLGQVATNDGNVVGRSAKHSAVLANLGRTFRTELLIPSVELESVISHVCQAATTRSIGVLALVDEYRRAGGHSKAAPHISSRVLEYLVKTFALLAFKQRNDIVDRWHALADSQ